MTTIRRAQHHENVRQEILKAALAQVRTRGVSRLSLRELARRTGYSPASLYEYFDGKDAIITTLQAEGLQLLSHYLAQSPADLPAPQRLVELGLAYLNFAKQQPDYFELVFTQLPSKRKSSSAPVSAYSPYGLLLQAITAGIASRELVAPADMSAEGMAYSLWAFVHGMAVLQTRHLRQFEADFPTIQRAALEKLAGSFRR